MTLLSTRHVLAVALAVGAFGGCGDGCCTDVVASTLKPGVCAPSQVCPEGDAFRFGKCVAGGCSADTDCCPGSRCRADLNACFPLLLDNAYDCADDACPDPAQRCILTAIGARDPIPTCVFELCGGSSDCGFGRTCFEGRCVQRPPCGGSCPDGTACDVVSSQCSAVPNVKSCSDACVGLRVVADPNTMLGEACCDVSCDCVGLPPLVPTRYGRYSRVAVGANGVLVSNYDGEFGDLVVAHYAADGTPGTLDYVDGFPSGPVTADPTGPRGGVADVGQNVGTHTSIALDQAGNARVAYHDEDAHALKVAVQTGGVWSNHVVDTAAAGGDIGKFTDIAVAANGTIWVSYLAHNVSLGAVAGRGTGLKLAKSRTPTPASAADWELFVVDARPVLDPCGGSCTAGTACVLASGGGQCLPVATDCTETCSSTQTCVSLAGSSSCTAAALPPESVELPRARGLYSSITLDGADPVVAYYDLVDGDVRAARVSQAGVATVFVVDGDGVSGHRAGDVGRFPTVSKVGPDLMIAYEDFSRHELRVWQGTTPGQGGSTVTVDTGAQQDRSGKLFVGAGARLAKNASSPLLVYQDASNLDLKIASQQGVVWLNTALLSAGAHGFYSDVAIQNGTAYIVSVLAELDSNGVERSRLGLVVQPAP